MLNRTNCRHLWNRTCGHFKNVNWQTVLSVSADCLQVAAAIIWLLS